MFPPRAPFFCSVRIGSQEWVAIVLGRYERLLDRARADPADQVPHRARLVVRAGRACAAERLLADDGSRRLVVDVEVAGRVAEAVTRRLDRLQVAGENGSGQAVARPLVDEVERVLVARVVVDEGR